MGCAVVRCKRGPQVIQCDNNIVARRGHNRVHSILGPKGEMESTTGGVQHVDEAGEQQAGSGTTAAEVCQPVPKRDEESRFTLELAIPSTEKDLPDVVIAPPQAKNLEQRHSVSRLLLDGDEAHTTAALKLRVLLQKLDQGDIPNVTEMKKTLSYAADVLLGLVPRLKSEEEEDEDEELRREREQHVKAWVCSQYTKNETAQETRITPIERFRAVANTIMIGNFFGTLHREASFLRPKYPAGMDDLFEEQLNNWDFDIFKAESLSNKQPLRYVGQELFSRHDLLRKCNISSQHLENFLSKIEAGYGRYGNPYHNATHAADVAITTNYFIHSMGLTAYLTDLEVLAILLAAIIHDVDHPGTTNTFQIAQKTEYAMLYNDRSVLENHHLYYTFMIIGEDDSNILNGLTSEQYFQVRTTMVDIVLATDMGSHFDQIKQLKLILSGKDASAKLLGSDRSMLFNFLVHMADISHPGKPWDHHMEWTDRLCEEFFLQGDLERKLGRKVSPLCDRYDANIPDSQHGFIQFIVGPSFDVCGDMFELLSSHPASPNTPATFKMVQPAPGTDSSGSDGEDKTNEDKKEDKTNEDKKEDNLKTGRSKQIRVWADHLTNNKKNWKEECTKNEAEKAAQKAEEEKAQALVPVKAGKGRDLPPIKVPSSKQGPISNGSSDLNSPINSSDRDDSSDNANQSDSNNSGDKVDSSDASDHKHSSDLANHEDCKSHTDDDNHSNSSDHKHMNGSAFEKAEFHNKMNKLEERHTISTVQTVQIPGGSAVRTVQTVELRKITTNGTQQATFKNHNHEE